MNLRYGGGFSFVKEEINQNPFTGKLNKAIKNNNNNALLIPMPISAGMLLVPDLSASFFLFRRLIIPRIIDVGNNSNAKIEMTCISPIEAIPKLRIKSNGEAIEAIKER